MENDKCASNGTVVLAFLIGGVVGAGIALLVAPQSGKETRQKIRDVAEDAKEKIKNVADDAKAKLRTTFEHGKEALEDKKSIVTSAIEAGKKAMEEEKHRLSEKA